MKFKVTERRILIAFTVLLLVTTVADMYTALTSPVFQIAETNPIYVYTNSIWPLIAMTLFITSWIIVNLSKRISLTKIFLFCMLSLYLSVGHGFGAYSNIKATEQYEQDTEGFVERIGEVTVQEKVNAYFLVVGFIMLMPLVISSIAFTAALWIYDKRKPKREKIMDKIYELAVQLKTK